MLRHAALALPRIRTSNRIAASGMGRGIGTLGNRSITQLSTFRRVVNGISDRQAKKPAIDLENQRAALSERRPPAVCVAHGIPRIVYGAAQVFGAPKSSK